MEATEILMAEHRVIERVLGTLETAARQVEGGQPVRPGFFLDAADFVKGFADGCHHRKEENVLFTTLAEYGLPPKGGPIAVMLAEHEQGRAYIRALRAAATRWGDGEAAARPDVVSAARGYASLLRGHIAKEDGVLFPMADRLIPGDRQAQVSADFERVEHEETGAGVHEKYLALADSLAAEIAAAPTQPQA